MPATRDVLPMLTVLGIDPSLTSTGWAIGAEEGITIGRIRCGELRGFQRLRAIHEEVEGLLRDCQPDLVVYEGYAMGKFLGKAFDRIELSGVLKYSIWGRKIPLLVVPPSSLKLFLTGNGRAEKEDMMREASRLYGRLIRNSDEADALGLMVMGQCFSNRRILPRDGRHYKRRALSGCELLDRDV